MKSISLLALVLLSNLSLAQAEKMPEPAEQENFSILLGKISDSHWKGNFKAAAKVGLVRGSCKGPLKVRFFPGSDTDLPGEVPTVSYRHDADFSSNLNPLCDTLGKSFSVIDLGGCENFPLKANLENGQTVMVPFRTLVPRNGGNSAVVSSPSCKKGQVVRQELELRRLQMSADGNTLLIQIVLDSPILKADLTYELHRCEEGDDCL